MLIACVEGRDYPTALKLMDDMRTRGVPMNALTYTAAITAAQKAGDVEAAVRWLDAMSANRSLQQSELMESTTSVSAHSRTWSSKEALALLSKFGRRQEAPRTAAYSEAIQKLAPGKVVLDIGTGQFALLAFIAQRLGLPNTVAAE